MWSGNGCSPSEGVLQCRDAWGQQRLCVLRDRTSNEPQDAYLVLVTRFLVVPDVEKPIGTRGDHSHVLEQCDDVRR